MAKTLPFKIAYVDNLGQGVSKVADKITLINKTLPGDEGECTVTHETSKIIFAQVESYSKKSAKYEDSICPHYSKCQGCHYLHTTYENEVQLKKSSYAKLFSSVISDENIDFVHADSRHGYRNRIQLHYDKKQKVIGFRNKKGITSIKNCLMASSKIQKKIESLSQEGLWSLLSKEKNSGHIEFLEKDQSIELSINKGYAAGGFNQVNDEMNKKLLDYLRKQTSHLNQSHYVVDLFGGGGNLSTHLNSPTLVVDNYSNKKSAKSHQSFLSLDIYRKNAAKIVKDHCQKDFVDWLIIDPPRSGLKNIVEFTETLKPQTITYISCNPQTQKRDISSLLEHYDLINLTFFDLFPSTFHLESAALLVRKNSAS